MLGYLLNRPFSVVALIGPKSLADLKDSLSCTDAKLSKQDIDYLEHGDAQALMSCFPSLCSNRVPTVEGSPAVGTPPLFAHIYAPAGRSGWNPPRGVARRHPGREQ